MKKNINQILDNKSNIFLLIGLSFIIRLVIIFIYHDNQIDQEWLILLNNLVNYKNYSYYGSGVPSVMLPPLYPFFLYFLEILTFNKINLLNTIIFVQIILSTTSVYIFYKINQKIFSQKLSLISSFVFSFVPINIYAAGQTSSITLQIFLTLLFFLLLFDLSDNKNKKKILFFSIISGLLILTRGEFILIYIITLAYFFLKKKINLTSLISIFLCTLITISPYLIRNYNTFNQVFVVKSIGFNLWKGNNELSTIEGYGDFNLDFYEMYEADLSINPNFKNLNDEIKLLNKDKFYELNKDKIFLKQAIKNLKEEPFFYFKLFFEKVFSFYFINFNSTHTHYYNIFHFLPILLISIISLPGLILALKEKQFKMGYLNIYLILTIIIFSVFFILPRYKLIIIPIQIILMIYFLQYIFKKLNKDVI